MGNSEVFVPSCDDVPQVIGADGEKLAARSLKEAADIISESKGALQLRYLQTLASIAAEKNSTIVFPLPLELFRGTGSEAAD